MKRNFIIGDNWVYFKIYSGTRMCDRLLQGPLLSLSNKLIVEGIAQKWFFIRYADPKHHIRLRYFVNNTNSIHSIINKLNKAIGPYFDDGLISNIQIDTYKRELERYGFDNIIPSEDIFFHDSVMMAKSLQYIGKDSTDLTRWLFGMKTIDQCMNDFAYSIQDKFELMSTLKSAFGEEFGMNKNLKKQLSKKYAKYKSEIFRVLSSKCENDSVFGRLIELLDEKSISTIQTINVIKQNISKDKLDASNLIASYIHMQCNRLFKSKQRLYEMVVYDFLCQHYKSLIAIEKYTKKLNKNAVPEKL